MTESLDQWINTIYWLSVLGILMGVILLAWVGWSIGLVDRAQNQEPGESETDD